MNHFGQSIRYFVKTVELGSLTLAATHFEISQSAISQQLSALEKEVGTRLFLKKDKTGISLSPAGEILYQKGKAILEQFDSLILEVKDLNREKNEGAFSYMVLLEEGHECLREYLASFLLARTNVEAVEGTKTERALIEKLEKSKIDAIFALKVPDKIEESKDLTYREVATLPLRALFSSYSFYGSLSAVEQSDLAKLTFVQDEERGTAEKAIADLVGIDLDSGFPRHVKFMSRIDALEEAKNNRGFLLANPFDQRLESDGLKDSIILSNGAPIAISVYLIWNKKNPTFNPKLIRF